jgi:sugar lactone lactonase YvrE
MIDRGDPMTLPTTLESGLGLLESPRWHDGRLWFADWTAGQVRTLDEGGSHVVVEHASLPLCFDFLPDGDPVLVSGPRRALLRVAPDGRLQRYADLAHLSEYGGNDIVVDGRGNTYVNNVGAEFGTGPWPEGAAPGFVALVTPDGVARVVADDLSFPNGMAVTADGSTLVVAESYRGRLTAYDIAPDGGLSARRTWADLGDAAPDGICLDVDGAAWYADVPHRCCVRVAEGGEVLDRVDLDRGAFACMLGGPDGRTLHVVAAAWPGGEHLTDDVTWDGVVLGVPAPAGGAGWPART